MNAVIKSAFTPIRPKISPSTTVAASAPARSTAQQQSQHSNGRVPERKVPIPAGPPISVPVELWVETINDPNKHNPCFAHVSAPQQEGVTRLTVTFNLALWPASGALARADQTAIKWLTALALIDRHLTWRGHPVLKAVGDHLARLVEYPQDFKKGLWAAYKLKDSPLLEPIPKLLSTGAGPVKFGGFDVEVDSLKLETFRARMARRFRKRPEHQPAATVVGG
jgi:hypothetical protein